MAARHLPKRAGWEELVGAVAEVRQPVDPEGKVFLNGALWRAVPAGTARGLGGASRVRVESVEGLTLKVAPIEGADVEEAVPAGASDQEGTS